MDHRLVEGLMEAIAPVIRDSLTAHVEKATAPLVAQITELNGKLAEIEAREPEKGEPGASVTIDDVRPLIDEAIAALPKPEDGKSVTPNDVRPMLEEMVSAIPKAQDGKSVTLDEVRPLIDEAVAALPPAEPGKSVDPQEVAELISTEVEKAVSALPKPENGKDADPVGLPQVVEAIKSFDVEQLIADALAGQYGIDVVAPEAVAKEMGAALSLLAEPLVKKEAPSPVQQAQRPRKLTFERDEQNRIVAAVEE